MENTEQTQVTCLHDKHLALGAKMAPFAGFDMPIEYTGIVAEHNAVRHACGIFDVSHMGEVFASGSQVEEWVNHIFTNDVRGLASGGILYGMMCRQTGGVVDDLLAYKLGEGRFLLVINAANIDKDYAWMQANTEGFDVTLDNQSHVWGQVAIQGPDSEKRVEELLGLQVSDMAFYTGKEDTLYGEPVIVSRTGYTGEDGFEIYASHAVTRKIWDTCVEGGVTPCGLGCRDTLRFEVGLPLYGHELNDDITPVEAGLSMFCKLDKPEFIGEEALTEQKANGVKQRVVGIELKDKAIPRNGYDVETPEGERIGYVTTGYNTISTGKSVCMALVDARYGKLDTEVRVRIRKKTFAGVVVKKRFYQKNYHK